ncbi:unnamed protein product [Merluccius merluccius]
MAGSRLEKFGTVFTRVRDLKRAGVISPQATPTWYDVFKAFPPRKEPLYVQPQHGLYSKQDPVPDIFYKEDKIRAKFYEVYGTGSRVLDLSKSSYISACQRFVETYTRLESYGEMDESALFEETGKLLLSEGLVLRRRGAPVPEYRDPVLDFKLTDMLAEQQSGSSAENQ